MTSWIEFDHLTWPDVAKLPRNCPIILPLGEGYHREELITTLSNPPQIALLPPIPFGWTGSAIPVTRELLTNYIKNLLQSMRDDGFVHVYLLSPPGLDFQLGSAHIVQSYSPNQYCFTLQDKDKVVLIPIGHTEQHGYHLPLSTDTAIIDAIAQGVENVIPDLAIATPVIPYGVSTHRSTFAGTLNAGGRAFEDFWLGVIDTMVLMGFSRFYLLSGHGGNCSFLVNVIKYAGERYPDIFCATSYLYLNSPEGIRVLEKHRESKIGGMGHACELETSLMLHLHPELVHMERVIDETAFISTPSYYMDWIEGGALVANPPWSDDTQTGAYGAGSLATPEKGKIWLKAAIDEKTQQVYEIHEQYTRRLSRKKPKNL
jgi:creatinine amidohydrolase